MEPRLKGPKPKGWWWAENAVYDVKMGHFARAVYLYLRRRAASDGTCFPSLKLIASECEISRSSAQRAIEHLQEIRLLRVKSGKFARSVNVYIVLRPKGPRQIQEGPTDPHPVVALPLDAHDGSQGVLSGLPDTENGDHVRKTQGRSRAVVLLDDQFLEELKKNPAYKGIDIDREMGKLDAWLLTPRGAGKKKTRQRAVNWLNGVDRPMAPSKVTADGRLVIRIPDLPDDVAALVLEYKKSEPGTSLQELAEKAQREIRRRKEG